MPNTEVGRIRLDGLAAVADLLANVLNRLQCLIMQPVKQGADRTVPALGGSHNSHKIAPNGMLLEAFVGEISIPAALNLLY